MGLTQANRFAAIDTPLGADVLVLKSFSFREQLGRLFLMELELLSEDPNIDFDDIVGEKVTVRLELADDKTRYFNGYISRFVQTAPEGKHARYRATMVPWLWFLTRTADCRIFQKSMPEPPDKMTVPGIIKKVFKDQGFEDVKDDGLTQTYDEWEYCVQYRETDFNFVSRLMEQEGIYYFFTHEDGKHTLVLADSISAHETFPGYDKIMYHAGTEGVTDRECLSDWVVEMEVQPGTYALNDFDFEKPKKALLAKSNIEREHAEADYEMYDYPGEYLEHNEGEAYAKVRIEELQTQHEVLHGESSARGLSAGFTFTLEDHPRDDQNREYLITSTSIEVVSDVFTTSGDSDTDSFDCSLTAIDSKTPFRPARITPRPLIQGPQTAIVVGPKGYEIYTDKHARVKVQFHWDRYGKFDDNSSCWIRVSQSNAGKSWGSMITPRIGQEVIIEFLEGDPDRPIITGRVYNGDQPPPYASGQGVVSGLKSNTHKGNGYNEMSMDDTAGKEKITIHGQYDMNTTVEHDQTTTVHNNRTDKIDVDDSETVGKDQTGTVGGNQTLAVAKDRTRTVGKNEKVSVALTRTHSVGVNEAINVGVAQEITVGAAQAITVGANQATTVGGKQANAIAKDRSTTVGANDTLSVAKKLAIDAGEEIMIKTGDASIHMKKDGTIAIKGKDISVEGSGEINVKASKNITMKGQKILQN